MFPACLAQIPGMCRQFKNCLKIVVFCVSQRQLLLSHVDEYGCADELKLCFIIWLVSPATRGAELIYNRFVWKFLHKYASEFDPTFRSSATVRPPFKLFVATCRCTIGLCRSSAVLVCWACVRTRILKRMTKRLHSAT